MKPIKLFSRPRTERMLIREALYKARREALQAEIDDAVRACGFLPERMSRTDRIRLLLRMVREQREVMAAAGLRLTRGEERE